MAEQRIPEELAPEVFKRAAELYAEHNQTYTLDQLTQAGEEVQIPPEFVKAALRQIEQQQAETQKQQARQRQIQRNVQIGAIAVGAVLVGWGILTYNALSAAQQNTDLAWAQVENQLQRRADLIPNLVSIAEVGAQQEQTLVEQLTDSRVSYLAADTPDEQIAAAGEVTQAIEQFQTYVNRNPQFQTSQLYIGVQDEMAGTENRIAVERQRYNEAVAAYNQKLQAFPNSIVAGLLGFESKPLLNAAD